MLLESAKDPFDSDDYITEIKFDGIRLLASKDEGRIRLYTRHNNEVTAKFPELHTLQIPDGTVLDGELIVPTDRRRRLRGYDGAVSIAKKLSSDSILRV